MKHFSFFCLIFFLFATSNVANAAGAALQKPIPPAAEGHFFIDKNNDGVADGFSLLFLKPIDSSYLKNLVDSISLAWPDSEFRQRKISLAGKNFKVDSKDSKRAIIDWSHLPPTAYSISSPGVGGGNSSATLFQKSSHPVQLLLKDKISPILLKATFRAGKMAKQDTLRLLFSEPVKISQENGTFEIYSPGNKTFSLRYSALSQNDFTLSPKLLLSFQGIENISNADSVRFEAGLAIDSSENLSLAQKVKVTDIPAFRILSSNQAKYNPENFRSSPVFELTLHPEGTPFPKNRLGMAVDLFDVSFLEAVRNILYKDTGEEPKITDISVRLELSVFTGFGAFVSHSTALLKGSDPQVADGIRAFFLWNFMDGHRRLAGSGVYLLRSGLQIFHKNKLIYREDGNITSSGLRRQSQ